MSSAKSEAKGFNWLSVSVGGALLVIWIALLVRSAPTMHVRRQYLFLIPAFGAIFTLFAVKLAFYRPAVSVAAAVGLALSLTAHVLVAPRLATPFAAVVVVAFAVALAFPLHRFLFKKLIAAQAVVRPAQLAVIYAILVSGIGAGFLTKISIEAASEYWKEEWHLEKWLPPHFLPKYDARASKEPPTSTGQGETPAGTAGTFPDKGAKEGWLAGRSKIPWVAWLTGRSPGAPAKSWTFPLFFWICLVLTFEFFFLLFALAFRKRWIEEERLRFPTAQFPITIIGDGSESHERSLFHRRATWIGLALGFFLCAYSLMRVGPTGYAQMEPDMPFMFHPAIVTRFDLTGYKIVSNLQVLVWLSPITFLFILFAPLEVISTCLLTFFATRVVLAWIVQALALQDQSLPGYITRGIAVGGIGGLAFWSVIFNAGALAGLFKSFFRGAGGGNGGGFFSLRTLLLAFWALSLALGSYIYPLSFGPHFRALSRWLLLAGTALMLLYVVLSRRRESERAGEDVPLGAGSILLLLACMGLAFIALTLPGRTVGLLVAGSAVVFAYVFAAMRMHAESTVTDTDVYRAGRLDATLQARWLPGPSAQGAVVPENRWWNTAPGVTSHFYAWGFASLFRIYGPQGWFLGAFKVGSETGASARDIMKAVVFALVLGSCLAAVLTLHTGYTYGYITGRPISAWYEDTFTWTNRTYIFGTSSMEPPDHYDIYKLYTHPLVCFLLVGLLMYMRREYAWFPLHPVGFVMGGLLVLGPGNPLNFWFTMLLAYAFKKLVFKWFGVRFFKEKVQPVVVFAMMGILFAMVLYLLRFVLEYKIGSIAWR